MESLKDGSGHPPRIERKMKRKAITNRIKIIETLKAVYGDGCFYCKRPLDDHEIEIDHYVAVNSDGENKIDNYRICCCRCNRIKSDKDFYCLYERLEAKIKKIESRIMPYIDELSYLEEIKKTADEEIGKELAEANEWLEKHGRKNGKTKSN